MTSPSLTTGTTNKAYTLIGFDADHAGKFYLICDVPGHLASGMWDNFVVSSTATTASITTTP